MYRYGIYTLFITGIMVYILFFIQPTSAWSAAKCPDTVYYVGTLFFIPVIYRIFAVEDGILSNAVVLEASCMV